MVPVRKPDGSVRICVDYRELNAITPLRRHWLPSLQEILDKAGNSCVMSKLDLTSGFHQLELEEESRELTSFSCPAGKFEFTRLPFGLKNAPAIFQATIEEVLRPVRGEASTYIDDVLIYSKDWESHLQDVRKVVGCLGEAGLTVKKKKCEWGRKSMMYLGHKVGSDVMAVPECRVLSIKEYGKPKTKK